MTSATLAPRDAPSKPDNPWRLAAERLAARVERRAAAERVLLRLGQGLTLGAVAGLALRLAGQSLPVPLGVASVGAALGALRGWMEARRLPPVGLGAAAWALDRLGGRGERGLTAALHERHVAGAPLPGPEQRLLPPRGLGSLVAGLLLTTLLCVWPATQGPSSHENDTAGDGPSRSLGTLDAPAGGHGGANAQPDASAANPSTGARGARESATERRALETGRVRQALGLPREGAEDAALVKERLLDPDLLDAARRAAEPGSPLEQALAAGASAPDEVGRRLAAGQEAAARLEAERRRALARSLSSEVTSIAAARRSLVERYLAARARPPANSSASPQPRPEGPR